MTWFFLALAATLCFAAQELLMRILAIKTTNPRLFSLVFNTWGALFAGSIFLIQKGSLSTVLTLPFHQYILIFSVIVVYGMYERTQFLARKHVDASTMSILFRISTVIGFVGSALFLHEPVTLNKIIGTTLIIAASIVLIHKNPKLRFHAHFWLAVFVAVLLGIAAILDRPASMNIEPSLYSFLIWLFPLTIIAFPSVPIRAYIREFTVGGIKVAAAALLNTIGYILYIQALSMTQTSNVIPITSLTGLLAVLGGIFLLHERDHLINKYIAAGLAFIGVYLLS